MSLQAFAEVNKIGLQFPRTKIAMLMRSYKKPPTRTWCLVPEAAWTKSAKMPWLPKLEASLRFFQCTCKPAIAGMKPIDEMALMSNVSIAAAEAFVLCKERGQEGEAMLSAVARFFEQIKVFAAANNLGPPPRADQSWLDFDRVKHDSDNTAVADKEPAQLLPIVIMYDEQLGLPINAQDVRAAPGKEASISTVPWEE